MELMKQKSTLLSFIILLSIFISCKPENDTINSNSKQNKLSNEIISDTLISSKAKFIAGKKTNLYSELQNADFYNNYQLEIDASWNKLYLKNLLPIKNWLKTQNITNENDSTTLFYPFSGPDFLYANTLFPYCRNYILFGLENPGIIPDFKSMNDTLLEQYFDNLLFSLKHINKMGFFITKQMKYDFRKKHFNGVIHILLFYLVRTEHQIISCTPFYLDPSGTPIPKQRIEVLDKRVQGIKLVFWKKDSKINKNLYYIQIDANNENIMNKLEFTHFISHFPDKITFLKSASYLLHNDTFSIVRDIVVEQSQKILQDDTGVPFKYLQNDTDNNIFFNLRLFGNYSRTINIYSEKYQPKLQKALVNEEQEKKLPFKFGYNKRFGETILIFAEKQKNETTTLFNNDEIIYKVQLQILWKKIPVNSKIFDGLPPVDYYFDEGYYKYTIGNTTSEAECRELLHLAQGLGFEQAFIAGFYHGNRIVIEGDTHN